MAEPQVTQATAFVAEHSPKLSELAGLGDQVKAAISAVEDVAAQADVRLRQETAQVTQVIDLAVGTLKKQVGALVAATNAARATPHSAAAAGLPSPAPVLGVQTEQLAELQRRADDLRQVSEQSQQRLVEARVLRRP